MSEFIANLIGRSQGTLEVVRARVPALYEPYRRETGQQSIRAGFSVFEAREDGAATTGTEHPPTQHEEQTPEDGEQTNFSGRVEAPIPSQAAPALLTKATRPGRLSSAQDAGRVPGAAELDAPPISRPANLALLHANAESKIHKKSLGASQSVENGEVKREAIRPPLQTKTIESGFEPRGRLITNGAEPISSLETQSQIGNLPDPANPVFKRPQAPFITPAVRPPAKPRAQGRKTLGEMASFSAPESSVQVSIGRVEVRAIFPEPPPVRRAPAPRSSPIVSLDDYLNRQIRGKR